MKLYYYYVCLMMVFLFGVVGVLARAGPEKSFWVNIFDVKNDKKVWFSWINMNLKCQHYKLEQFTLSRHSN